LASRNFSPDDEPRRELDAPVCVSVSIVRSESLALGLGAKQH
jgi:hypothetical protein